MTILNITGFTLWANQNQVDVRHKLDVKTIFKYVVISQGFKHENNIITPISTGLHSGGHLGRCCSIKNQKNPETNESEYYTKDPNNIEFKFILDLDGITQKQTLSVNIYTNHKTKISGGATGIFGWGEYDSEHDIALLSYTTRLTKIVEAYINSIIPLCIDEPSIVNITSHFVYPRKVVHNERFVSHARGSIQVDYEPEIFCGMKMRVQLPEKTGTCILFHSGKGQIMGVRNIRSAFVVFGTVTAILDEFTSSGTYPQDLLNYIVSNRPHAKKHKSVGFKYSVKTKQKKKCGSCGDLGHNIRTCRHSISM